MPSNLFETPTTGVSLDSVDYYMGSTNDGKPCLLVYLRGGRRSIRLHGVDITRFKEEFRAYKGLQFQVLKRLLKNTTARVDIFGSR